MRQKEWLVHSLFSSCRGITKANTKLNSVFVSDTTRSATSPRQPPKVKRPSPKYPTRRCVPTSSGNRRCKARARWSRFSAVQRVILSHVVVGYLLVGNKQLSSTQEDYNVKRACLKPMLIGTHFSSQAPQVQYVRCILDCMAQLDFPKLAFGNICGPSGRSRSLSPCYLRINLLVYLAYSPHGTPSQRDAPFFKEKHPREGQSLGFQG